MGGQLSFPELSGDGRFLGMMRHAGKRWYLHVLETASLTSLGEFAFPTTVDSVQGLRWAPNSSHAVYLAVNSSGNSRIISYGIEAAVSDVVSEISGQCVDFAPLSVGAAWLTVVREGGAFVLARITSDGAINPLWRGVTPIGGLCPDPTGNKVLLVITSPGSFLKRRVALCTIPESGTAGLRFELLDEQASIHNRPVGWLDQDTVLIVDNFEGYATPVVVNLRTKSRCCMASNYGDVLSAHLSAKDGRITTTHIAGEDCIISSYDYQNPNPIAQVREYGTIRWAAHVDSGKILCLKEAHLKRPELDWVNEKTPRQRPPRLSTKVWQLRAVDSLAGLEPSPLTCYLFTPSSSLRQRKNRAPQAKQLVLYLGGGPGALISNQYDPIVRSLSRLGYDVLVPCIAGSGFRGDGHLSAIVDHWGERDVCDVLSALEAAWSAGYSPEHTTVFGHSYGGFVALLLMSERLVRFKKVISWSPLVDLTGAFQSYNNLRLYLKSYLPSIDEESIRWKAASPLSKLGHLESRLFVVHGELDEVVPVLESRKLALKLGADSRFRYHEIDDAGHAVLGSRKSRRLFYKLLMGA